MTSEQPRLLHSVADARRMLGLGNTRIYELIGNGTLVAVKAGNRTLIRDDSLRAYVDSLPRAHINMGLRRAA